jgi:hypothetical protein
MSVIDHRQNPLDLRIKVMYTCLLFPFTYDRFLSYHLQFIIHLSSFHFGATQCSYRQQGKMA